MLMGLLDEIVQHRLGHLKFGDDPVPQRADGDDVGRRPPHHLFGLGADGENPTAIPLNGHPRGLVDDNSLAPDVDQGIGRAQVNANIQGKEAQQSVYRIPQMHILT